MGDIGEYWKEQKAYKQDSKFRQEMGMTWKEYYAWQRQSKIEDRLYEESLKVFECSCGQKFKEKVSQISHSKAKGKKKHILRNPDAKSAKETLDDNWAIF